jgi:two-component system chemotaxis sensor kinase CheA
MGTDLEKFHDGFFAESLEALQTVENAVLQLAPGTADTETINSIFRVVHSIKSSAGMFGFNEMASFAHALESLLQELRSGRTQITRDICDGLLQSVDQLRAMIAARQLQQSRDSSPSDVLQLKFREWVGATPAATTTGAQPVPVWRIGFRPLPELLKHGTDPIRMFEELAALGTLGVQADCTKVPALPDIDPERCHIRWDLTLATHESREVIDQVFEWAYGNCELEIEKIAAPRQPVVAPAEIDSIRVAIEKLDELLHKVEHIAISQLSLEQLVMQVEGPHVGQLKAGLLHLGSSIGELQESVKRMRTLPAGSMFNRFPRLVRDLSARLGKQVRLQIAGERTELDRKVLEKIGDPLVHLVRNSVDHGIETPEVRAARGKATEGLVHLSAVRNGESIQIVISDDGNGLDTGRLLEAARRKGLVDPGANLTDEQIHDLVFLPGFSTTAQATEISGRGVGMDVVRRNISELGGSVELRSEPGKGTTTIITLSQPIYARNSVRTG